MNGMFEAWLSTEISSLQVYYFFVEEATCYHARNENSNLCLTVDRISKENE